MEKGENKKVTFARKKKRKKRGRNSRERKQHAPRLGEVSGSVTVQWLWAVQLLWNDWRWGEKVEVGESPRGHTHNI